MAPGKYTSMVPGATSPTFVPLGHATASYPLIDTRSVPTVPQTSFEADSTTIDRSETRRLPTAPARPDATVTATATATATAGRTHDAVAWFLFTQLHSDDPEPAWDHLPNTDRQRIEDIATKVRAIVEDEARQTRKTIPLHWDSAMDVPLGRCFRPVGSTEVFRRERHLCLLMNSCEDPAGYLPSALDLACGSRGFVEVTG